MSASKPPSGPPPERPARPQGAHGGPRPPSAGEHVDVTGRARDAAAPDASLQDELEHERRERARDEATLGEMLVHIAELERGLREAQASSARTTELGRAVESAEQAAAEAAARARELEAEVQATTAERDTLAARLRELTVASEAATHEVRATRERTEKLEHELRAAIDARSRAERDSIELAAEADERGREAESRGAIARELEARVTELEARLDTTGREVEAARESAARDATTRHELRRMIEALSVVETQAAEQRSAVLERARALLDGPDVEPHVSERKVAPIRAAAPAPPPPPPVAPHLAPIEELTLELSELEDG